LRQTPANDRVKRRPQQPSPDANIAAPRSSVFICGVPRSGTWLLAHLLHSSGVVGYPGEFFWRGDAERNREAWGVSTFREYLDRVSEVGTAANGVFAAKLMWGYFDDFMSELRGLTGEYEQSDLSVIGSVFPHPRFVWMRRDDVVAQAVSWAKALKTGQFAAHQPRTGDAIFDYEQIDGLAHAVRLHDGAWRRWFVAHGIEPFEVTYEELCEDRLGTTLRALGFLGLEPLAEAKIAPPSGLQKQANEVDAEWIGRYRRRSQS
jgi:trehalose 2-sulfotransferase